MRILFVKDKLAWPRSAGHDVHCYYMMQAMSRLGHEIGLATVEPTHQVALKDLHLTYQCVLAKNECISNVIPLSPLQERFRSYWGIEHSLMRAVDDAGARFGADAVVAVGLNVLPYLASVHGSVRVWYAADEWVWHHLSQVRIDDQKTWGHCKAALIKGLYERVYAPLIDRVWVVSPSDQKAMKLVCGISNIDLVPNGVDTAHFYPRFSEDSGMHNCVFWGRLDFGPNVQALEWFCRKVWPSLRRRYPEARFTIYGFQPVSTVQILHGKNGISVIPDLPDLREEIGRHQVAVLPFHSGGGIKNKLLEAASLGMPIVCTPRSCGGLRGIKPLPLSQARNKCEWVEAISDLWTNSKKRFNLGTAARYWVQAHHTWELAARTALAGLQLSHCVRLRTSSSGKRVMKTGVLA